MQWNSNAMQVIEDVATAKSIKYRAMIQLGLSARTIERKVFAYKKMGRDCFQHGNTNRKPVHIIDFPAIATIIANNNLEGCNFSELSRLL